MSANVSAITSHAGSPDSSFEHQHQHQQQQHDEKEDSAPRPSTAPAAKPASRPHKNAAAAAAPASASCSYDIESPPPPPPADFAAPRRRSEGQKEGVSGSGSKPANNNSDDNTCPFCTFDATRVLSNLSTMQFEMRRLALRLDVHEERQQRECEQVGRCLAQVTEYNAQLGVVSKWASAMGGELPRFLRSMASATTTVLGPNEVLIRSEAPADALDVAVEKENTPAAAAAAAGVGSAPAPPACAMQHEDTRHQQSMNSAVLNASSISNTNNNNAGNRSGWFPPGSATAAYIPIGEVRAMFSQFRDEIVRLRERNEMLEQRLNDAVAKFDGSNINKLKADVEGRLRTMLHSLHETMNGGGGGSGNGGTHLTELSEQVSSLRTEVELLRGKTEAAASARTILEARLSDCQAKVRDMGEAQLDRSRHEQATLVSQREELRDLRGAIKELGATVSQRLESERSAREFESGDIRSQLRVLLRSPSPMARIGDPRSPATGM